MIETGTRLVDRYELRERLGAGGMGDVWLAWDASLERLVAVKVLRGADQDDAQRFRAEARAQAPLAHPSIVRLLDTGSHEGTPFLVMTYVDGQPLSLVLEDGPLPPERVMELGRQIAGALAHAHDRGVVHRDVKPANVLVDGGGQAYLTDFGIARLEDSARLTGTGMVMGTAPYVAPEQLESRPVTPAADVYSLGLILLEVLTGRREYTGTPIEAAMARLHRPPLIPAELPPPWPDLLAALVASDPQDRPSAAHVAALLSRPEASSDATTAPLARPAPAAAPTEALPDATARTSSGESVPPRRSTRPRPRWALGAAVVAAVLIAGLLVLMGPQGDGPQATEPASLQEALDRLEDAITP